MSERLVQLWGLLPGTAKAGLTRLTLLTIIAAIAELATFAALAAFLARLGSPAADLGRLGLLFAIVALATAAVRLWLTVVTNRLTAMIAHDLAEQTQRRLIHQPLSFHAHFNSARALAMLDKVQLVATHVFYPVVQLTQSLLIGGAILVMLLLKAPAVALAIAALIGLAYAIAARAGWRRIVAVQSTMADGFDRRTQTVQENFGGIRDIILGSLQDERTDSFARSDRRIQQAMATLQNLAAAPRLIVEGVGMALLGLLVLLLSHRGLAAMVPVLGLIAFAALKLLPLAQGAYGSWQSWIASRAVVDDVMAVLALPLREPDAQRPAQPFERSVALRDVSFAYPGGDQVLADVSLDLAKGERIGIVGETGSGKSTLGDVMMGLQPPVAGALLVDGSEVEAEAIAAWQRNVAHVGQQIFLLDASVADNVAFGDAAPDRRRIVEALQRAQLGEFAERLDEPIGEHGVRMSGGQRQRLNFARAFYAEKPFLLLDEATNALDVDTERRLLANLSPDQTVLIIAHRASALAPCNRVFELAAGRLTERGAT